MTDEDFEALLDDYQPQAGAKAPQVGDVVRARVISIGQDAVFVELGGKAEGVLDLDQVRDESGQITVSTGDQVEARVAETRDGTVVLRVTAGGGPDVKSDLAQAHELGLPIEGQVTSVNKGGVEVQVSGVRAFCPVSQLDNRYVEDANEFVGRKLTFRIIRFEEGRGKAPNIVLSRRVLLEEEARKMAEKTREKLEVGAVMQGRVTTIKPYGCFVDIGGIEGMVHISELGFGRVEHPGDVVRLGQTVEVQVIKIERTDDPRRPERIGLSMKALASDPFDDATRDMFEGKIVNGIVRRLEGFGVFVEVAAGVEGLIHISKLAPRRIGHPSEVVSVGDAVEVTVLDIDRPRKRISLALVGSDGAGAGAPDRDSYDQEYMDFQADRSAGMGTFADVFNDGGGRRGRRKGKKKKKGRRGGGDGGGGGGFDDY